MCISSPDMLLLKLKIIKNLCVKLLDNFLMISCFSFIIATNDQKILNCE